MTAKPVCAGDSLERLFHEPNRLAIMSALCAADRALAFVAIKTACNLTDGNLNRHLKVLQEAGAIRVGQSFVGGKPRTSIALSPAGVARFSKYLATLREVLEQAMKNLPDRIPRRTSLTACRQAKT